MHGRARDRVTVPVLQPAFSALLRFSPYGAIFVPSSAALRTPCQSRNPTVLSSSSVYRIGPKVREVQDSFLREISHVVDDAVRFVAVVSGDRGDPAVFYAASHLHFARDDIVLPGSEMFVPGYAGPLRAFQKNGPMSRSWLARSTLKSIPGKNGIHGS